MIDMSQTVSKRERHAGTRTCVGCGARVDRAERGSLVRLVLVPSAEGTSAVVDLGASLSGRGAWVHARRPCVDAAAAKGLPRAAKARVRVSGDELAAQIAAQADRRAASLVGAAWRAQRCAVGAQAVRDALRAQSNQLVMVARDAAAAAQLPEVIEAQGRGQLVAWGSKAQLGALFNRGDVGVLAIADEGIAQALRHAIAMAASFAQQGH